MTTKQFFRQFILVSLFALGILLLLFLIPEISVYQSFSLYCLLAFIALTVIMFYVGKFLSKQSNPQYFTAFALSFGFVKILLLLLLVVIFVRMASPQNRLFLLPFFTLYLIFTVFETHCLMKLGKNAPTS